MIFFWFFFLFHWFHQKVINYFSDFWIFRPPQITFHKVQFFFLFFFLIFCNLSRVGCGKNMHSFFLSKLIHRIYLSSYFTSKYPTIVFLLVLKINLSLNNKNEFLSVIDHIPECTRNLVSSEEWLVLNTYLYYYNYFISNT